MSSPLSSSGDSPKQSICLMIYLVKTNSFLLLPDDKDAFPVNNVACILTKSNSLKSYPMWPKKNPAQSSSI